MFARQHHSPGHSRCKVTSKLNVHFFKNMRQDSILADEVGSVATGKVLTFYSYGSGIVEK